MSMSKGEERKRVKGSSGVAAIIRSKKTQSGGGLLELRKGNVSKEMRIERSQSVSVSSGQHSRPVAPKPSYDCLRLQSVPGDLITASPGCSNGGIPTPQNFPPPKPPRVFSAIDFASVSDGGASFEAESWGEEEEEEAVWEEKEEEEKDHQDGDATHTQVVHRDKEEPEVEPSPGGKRPLLPVRSEGVASNFSAFGSDSVSSSTTVPCSKFSPARISSSGKREETGDGGGKVPLLPPRRSFRTPRRVAPALPAGALSGSKKGTSTSSSKTPLLPKVSSTSSKKTPSALNISPVTSPPYSKTLSVNPLTPPDSADKKISPLSLQRSHSITYNFETGSKSSPQCPPTSDTDSKLMEENERLRQQVLLLQSHLKSQSPSDNAPFQNMHDGGKESVFMGTNMLATNETGHRPCCDLSPCQEERELERVVSPSVAEKLEKPIPQRRTKTGDNSVPVLQSSVPNSPSNSAVETNFSKNKNKLKDDDDASRAKVTGSPVPKPRSNILKSSPPTLNMQDGTESIKREQKRDAVSGDGDDKEQNGDVTLVKDTEKMKAAKYLQENIPGCQATGAAVKSSGSNKEPHSTTPCTFQSSAISPSSSTSPVDPARSSATTTTASSETQGRELERPSTVTITIGAATTAMETTSETRNQIQAPSNLTSLSNSASSSSLSGSKPDLSSPKTVVKAPLKPATGHVATFQGKAKYKKVTLDDNSWIKRKASLPESVLEEIDSETGEDSVVSDSGSSKQPQIAVSNTGATPTTPLPYRSHSILPMPKPVLQPSFITPSPSPIMGEKADKVCEVTPARPPMPIKPDSLQSKTKKKGRGKLTSETKKDKRDQRMALTQSMYDEDVSPLPNEGKGKGKKVSKKPTQIPLVEEEPSSKPLAISKSSPIKFGMGRLGKKAAADHRPVSMMVDSNLPAHTRLNAHRLSELTSSATVSMPRGMQHEGVYKPPQKKGGIFGRLKMGRGANQKTEALPIPGEQPGESDSGSDDEKGGTIKKMPKLKPVPVEREPEDDHESQYHQLFEYVFVVGLKEDSKKKKLTTETTYTFPPMRDLSKDDQALLAIPQFCFPDIDQWKPTKAYKSESFSFVLTDMEGKRRFGYCRRLLPAGDGPRLPEVFCIVSPLGCFSLYENMLDHVEERRKISSVSVFKFLKAISANPFPRPGRSVEVKVFGARGSGMETLTFTRPMDTRLEHVDFSLLFTTLSQRKIIKLFSSLLMERRVIFCTSSLSLMTGCAHALMALLYPFEWQHFDEMDMEEAVVINLDKGKFLTQIGDEGSILPSKLFQFLEGKLGASIITSEYSRRSSSRRDSNTSKADELVVNTFMTFFAYLYGDYGDKMKVVKSGFREFQRASHIKRFSSKSTRRFLEAFQMTQMFESFLEVRETPSKAETLAASLFEKKLPELKEMCHHIEIFSSKSRFDRWKMKKELAKGD